jgi:hypothetical protein
MAKAANPNKRIAAKMATTLTGQMGFDSFNTNPSVRIAKTWNSLQTFERPELGNRSSIR